MRENKAQYQRWCGANQEWVTVNGVKTFKCPGWSKESEIIILANSTDCQTACDIYNGCYIYVGSTKTNSSGTTVNDGDEDGFTDGDNGDTDGRIDTTDTSGSKGCKVDVYKSMVDGYNAPATWTKTCSNGLTAVATKKTREALSKDKQSQYEEMIEKVKGIFLTDANGKISYGSYGAAGTPGCSKTPGESMAMCHAKRGYDDITTQSASGWSALRILNFWYKDAYLATKSASGTAMCEMYTPELTDGTSKLNWTDNNGSNHVADNNFDFETFLTKDNSTGTGSSIANYNALIKSVATSYGLGKRLSVVNVGTIYVSMLASMGVRGSYHFGGKYDKYGINPDTGKPANAKVEGTMSNVPKSFDCTGFFYWALKNAGLNTPPNLLAKTAEDSNYFDILDDNHKVIGVVGDALYHRNNGSTVHARLVIGHDVSKEGIITSNITIESAGGRGMIIDRYSIIDAETSGGQPFGIINLQRCYDGGSVNGASCSIVNEDDFFKGVDTGETISE